MKTWTEQAGIMIPIIQAPIGNACTVELVSAVSEAGGLGMFAASWRTPAELRSLIRETQSRTKHPFGVNLTLQWPQAQHDLLTVCLEEGVQAISLWWGDVEPFLRRMEGSDIFTLVTVGSAEEARHAESLGVGAVVAQGCEAGGHVWGRTSTGPLVAAVVDAIALPVIAAGGIGDARGIAGAFALGASGVWMGTRFVATQESGAHPVWKDAIVRAAEDSTIRGQIFDGGWPNAFHRTLRNSTVNAALAFRDDEKPGVGETVGNTADGTPVIRYSNDEPLSDWTGRIEEMCLYAGESCGVIHDLPSAGNLVGELWRDTRRRLDAASSRWSEFEQGAPNRN